MGAFVNLPVADLPRSIAFYTGAGFALDPRMTDDAAACIVIAEGIHAMLLTHAKWAQFTAKPVADTHRVSALMLAFDCPDRAAVDALMARVLAAGGVEPRPAQDLPFMYGRAFEDPDGHVWEPFWFDTATSEQGP
jgi:predicted lactoylglutathione lyase